MKKILDDVLEMKEKRKQAINWSKTNKVPENLKSTFDFINKKEKEILRIEKISKKRNR